MEKEKIELLQESNSLELIKKIQRDYFSLLESFFGSEVSQANLNIDEFNILGKLGSFINDLISNATSPQTIVTSSNKYGELPYLHAKILSMLDDIHSFWNQNRELYLCAIKNMQCLKLAYIDNNNWLKSDEKLRSSAIYFDTICVRDTLLHEAEISSKDTHRNIHFYYNILLHCFILIGRKSLFISDSAYPIALIYPGYTNGSGLKSAQDRAIETTRRFMNIALGTNYDNYLDIVHYVMNNDFNLVFSQMESNKHTQLLAQDLKAHVIANTPMQMGNTLEDKMNGVIKASYLSHAVSAGAKLTGGQCILTWIFRYFQSLEAFAYEASCLEADSYSTKIEFEFKKWSYQCCIDEPIEKIVTPEEIAILAMQSKDLIWFKNITFQDLIEIRSEGDMEEIRKIIRTNSNILRHASLKNTLPAVSNMIDNLNQHLSFAVAEAEAKRIETIKRKKRAWTDFGKSCILSLLAMPIPVLSLASLIFSGGSIQDIVKNYRNTNELKKPRPIDILLETKNRTK